MRKSKALIALLAAMICLSSCGAKPETAETEAATTTKAAETTEKAETEATTTAAETTEATTTTEAPPKELPKIKSFNQFLTGCMTFEADGKAYALNLVDKKLYEYDKNTYFPAVAHNIALTGEGKIYNFATGEEYEGEYLRNSSSYLTEFNPVYKVDEGFDGNVNYFGVIDWNGEWVLPLSSEYEICKNGLEKYNYNCSDSLIPYGKNGYIDTLYDFKNNKIYNSKDYGYSGISGVFGDNALFGNWNGGYSDLAKYNTKTGETTVILKNAGPGDYDGRDNNITWYSHGTAFVKEGSAIILDNNYNVLNYDLSKYKIIKVCDATEDYVLFASENTNGDNYAVILNKDGNRVTEPIKCNERAVFGAYISGDYVVMLSLEGKDYVIDCKTGETKIYEDDKAYKIERFDTQSGLLLVESDGAYYLADPADPDTLINPLEFAE